MKAVATLVIALMVLVTSCTESTTNTEEKQEINKMDSTEKVVKENGGKVPDRKAVAAAIRATKDFAGLTSNITFDSKGDPVKAAYFLVKVTTTDPAAWGKNEIVQTFEIEAPPLPAPATPAPTAAK